MTAALHGRAGYMPAHMPAGSPAGGEFAPDKGGGKSAQAQKRMPAKHPTHHGDGSLSFDAKSGHGTGYGMKGGDPRVHHLQEALNRLGLTDADGKKLVLDGKLGPKTTAAVKAAQKRLGLAQDGKVTPALLEKLAHAKSLPGRSVSGLGLCVRAFDFESRSGGDGRTLEGYAAVFDSPARIRDLQGDFDEVIRPGAFTRSLGERTPVLQFEHGKDPRVGAVPIGAIQDLREDRQGLYVRAQLFDNPIVEPVRQAIAAKAIRGMSFRFGVPDKGDTWSRGDGGMDQREIRDADVHELGPVVFPAYDSTSVSVRSLLAQLDPDEYRSLVRELAAHVGLAVDLDDDFTGRPDARSAGGGDSGVQPGTGQTPDMSYLLRAEDDALRLRGILK